MHLQSSLRIGSRTLGLGEGAVDHPVGVAEYQTHRRRQQHRHRNAVQLTRRNLPAAPVLITFRSSSFCPR